MLNKNDPLIGAVQQVMQQSNAEREATRLVNEAFGIEDRKALPHEYQAEWNSVYQQVLAEGVEALDEASLPKPPTSVKAVKALGMDERRSRAKAHKAEAKKHKDVYDTHHKRGSHGTQTAQKALDRYTHHNDMADRYLNPSNHFQNEKNRERDFSDGGVKVYNEAKIDHPNKRKLDVAPPYGELTKKDFSTLRAMGEDLEAIQEEIAYNLAEQAEYVYENYGDEGLVEFIDSLTEEQFELLSMHEGWGDQPGSPFDRIKKAVSGFFGGGSSSSSDSSSSAPKYTGNVKYTPKSADSQRASSTTGQGMARQQAASITPGGTSSSMGQQTGSGTTAPKPPKPTAKPADLNTTPKVKKKSAPKAAAPKASAPKAAAQPKKKLTFFQKSMINQKGNTEDQKRQLERRYGVRAPMKKAKRSVFGEQIRDIIAQRIDEIYVDPKADTPAGRAYKQTLDKKGAGAPLQAGQKWNAPNRSMGSDPTNTAKGTRAAAGPKAAPALDPTRNVSLDQPATKSPMAAALNRQDLAKSVQAGRVGDPGKQNFIQNARAQKEREKAAGGDGTKYLPVPPNVQKAIKDNQPQPGRPQTLSPGANPPVVSKNMSGGGGDYRKAQASPIKVSDTEVMNDPKFKKALSSVGGTQAAKKIQTGERVAGLGRMNKGDTIMSRVRTDIAARKNVGREL